MTAPHAVMAPPTSQKASDRPISFQLVVSNAIQASLALSIRPEDLSRDEPSRQTVTQTLGGAWLDDFGPGLSKIQIKGHTGWRGGAAGDGAALFQDLRNLVWVTWNSARKTAVDNGQTPDSVQLIFNDALDGVTVIVAPNHFSLKRNRQRPLLMMYELSMTILSETLGQPITDPLSLSTPTGAASADLLALGTDSLNASLAGLAVLSASSGAFLSPGLAQSGSALIDLASASFSAAISAVAGSAGLLSSDATSLVSIARSLALAGRNGFYAAGAIPGIDADAMFFASQVASALDNAFCVLGNCFVGVPQYPDYSSVYGASNCSSTVGGSPISPLFGQNALETLFPVSSGPVTVSTDAQANLTVMANSDPVFAPIQPGDLASRFTSIVNGVRIA